MKDKKLIIDPAWCKGCGICVALCPSQALDLEKGKVILAQPDKCTKCGQCEQRCPDYAIYVQIGEGGPANE